MENTSHYTPSDLATVLAEGCIPVHPRKHRFSVLDPACGDGSLLAAAKARLESLGYENADLYGVDINNDAVLACKARLPGVSVTAGDSLLEDWGDMRFDAVIMNPPFMGTVPSEYLKRLKEVYQGVKGRVDLAAFFLLLAERLCPRGTIGCLATKTIAEGQTRRAALKPMADRGWQTWGVPEYLRFPWPGAANVTVSMFWLTR